EAGRRTQTLLLGNGAEPSDLDPQTNTAYSDLNILTALFEGLTSMDEATSQPVPGVAERWESSADGLVWTFHLRADARWSNGDPVTAGDFVYSFHRILSPGLASEYSYMLYAIKNAEGFNEGKLKDFSQVGVRAIDDRTLEITLGAPCPFLPTLAGHQAWWPVHRATIEKFGRFDQRDTAWTKPGNLVGNGPFRLAEWTPNARIVVEKNPQYWDAGRNQLHAVVFFPIEDIATEERAFRAGQLHLTSNLLPDEIDHYRQTAPAELRIDLFSESYHLRFNTAKPPLNDVRVRRALGMAVDRVALARDVLRGSRTPAYALTPPNTAGYTPEARFPTDFAEARRLLAAAGYPGGKGFPRLQLQMWTNAINSKVAEALQQMWRRELGIDVTLSSLDFRIYLDNRRTLSFQISLSRWIADYIDPSTYLDEFLSYSGNNQTAWADPAFDRLDQEASRTLDQARRYALLQRAEARLLEQAPIAPLFYGARTYLIAPYVQGWVPTALGIHRYQFVKLAP
ncbi:MAG TPA: peptide ABC transporter substrate-binding protein, partial [Opitutaceae bacterium]|nr:peptide ABC transporter substrate-binding protein [Opitutaceae bacterium]